MVAFLRFNKLAGHNNSGRKDLAAALAASAFCSAATAAVRNMGLTKVTKRMAAMANTTNR